MANRSGKGGEFERDFSKKLSRYVSFGERDDIFWRSSQSGGRATSRAKQGKKTAGSYGDITTLDSEYSFVTETLCFELKKGYNKTNIQDLLDSMKKEPEYISFWNQCQRDTELGGRVYSIIVSKRDFYKTIIIIPRAFQNILSQRLGKRLYNRIDMDYNGLRLTAISLDDFFENVPAGLFLEVLRELHKKGKENGTSSE